MNKTNTEAVEALEPCPFCGSVEPSIHLYQQKLHHAGSDFWVAHCKVCNIKQERSRKSCAIAAWNTRTLSPTAKTEPSAAGLEADLREDVQQAINDCRDADNSEMEELLHRVSRSLSAPTRERESDKVIERAAKYDELIYAVGNKYPGETRHETALRYIRQAEEPKGGPGDALLNEGSGQ